MPWIRRLTCRNSYKTIEANVEVAARDSETQSPICKPLLNNFVTTAMVTADALPGCRASLSVLHAQLCSSAACNKWKITCRLHAIPGLLLQETQADLVKAIAGNCKYRVLLPLALGA